MNGLNPRKSFDALFYRTFHSTHESEWMNEWMNETHVYTEKMQHVENWSRKMVELSRDRMKSRWK